MKAKVNKRSKNLNAAVTLAMSVEEAVALEAVLGRLRGEAARLLPWYDDIADVLEQPVSDDEDAPNALAIVGARTISQATDKHQDAVLGSICPS